MWLTNSWINNDALLSNPSSKDPTIGSEVTGHNPIYKKHRLILA